MRSLIWFLLLCAPLCAQPAKHVLVISIDGLRPDAMMEAEAPVLHDMLKRGSYSLDARTVFPSITLTSHVSMMTGVSPLTHHVLWNEWEPARGPLKQQTMFDVAKDAGLTTAMFAGKEKFRHFVNGKRLDAFEIPAYEVDVVAKVAAAHIVAKKPNLIMVHLAEVDGAGHGKGWLTPEQFDAIERSDTAVGVLLKALETAGIAKDTAVIVSADHGGHARTHGTASLDDMQIPWVAAGAGVKVAGKLTAAIQTYDTAATAVALLGLAVPKNWDGRPVAAALAARPR